MSKDINLSEIQLSKSELRVKSLLGIPSWFLTIFLAVVFGGHNWGLYLIILVIGWYLYNLLYWKLYQRLMINQSSRKAAKFYVLLIVYQLVLTGFIALIFTEK